MQHTIKINSVLKKDRISLFCISCGIGVPGFFIIAFSFIKIFGFFPTHSGSFLTEKDFPFILIFTGISILIGLSGLLLRYQYFKKILKNTLSLKGRITEINKSKYFNEYGSALNLSINYEYLGKVFNKVKSVPDSNLPNVIRKGSEVTVLINPKKPKQFLIADLYVPEEINHSEKK